MIPGNELQFPCPWIECARPFSFECNVAPISNQKSVWLAQELVVDQLATFHQYLIDTLHQRQIVRMIEVKNWFAKNILRHVANSGDGCPIDMHDDTGGRVLSAKLLVVMLHWFVRHCVIHEWDVSLLVKEGFSMKCVVSHEITSINARHSNRADNPKHAISIRRQGYRRWKCQFEWLIPHRFIFHIEIMRFHRAVAL